MALTGYGQESNRRRAREAGFDDYLVKPVSLEALQKMLASLPVLRPAPDTARTARFGNPLGKPQVALTSIRTCPASDNSGKPLES